MRIILILCSILLSSCATTPTLYEKEPLELSAINIPVFKPVYLTIIVFDDEQRYVKMSVTSYKNMILNNKLIELYIREANAHIDAYNEYYKGTKE